MKDGIIMAKWNKANCMGYALGINEWLTVEPFEADYNCHNAYKMAKWLARNYNLKPVKRSEMELGKEYIVFRVGKEDWHFVHRSADGHWRHKPGWKPVRAISEKEVFSSAWVNSTLIYNSRPFIFEIPNRQ